MENQALLAQPTARSAWRVPVAIVASLGLASFTTLHVRGTTSLVRVPPSSSPRLGDPAAANVSEARAGVAVSDSWVTPGPMAAAGSEVVDYNTADIDCDEYDDDSLFTGASTSCGTPDEKYFCTHCGEGTACYNWCGDACNFTGTTNSWGAYCAWQLWANLPQVCDGTFESIAPWSDGRRLGAHADGAGTGAGAFAADTGAPRLGDVESVNIWSADDDDDDVAVNIWSEDSIAASRAAASAIRAGGGLVTPSPLIDAEANADQADGASCARHAFCKACDAGSNSYCKHVYEHYSANESSFGNAAMARALQPNELKGWCLHYGFDYSNRTNPAGAVVSSKPKSLSKVVQSNDDSSGSRALESSDGTTATESTRSHSSAHWSSGGGAWPAAARAVWLPALVAALIGAVAGGALYHRRRRRAADAARSSGARDSATEGEPLVGDGANRARSGRSKGGSDAKAANALTPPEAGEQMAAVGDEPCSSAAAASFKLEEAL